MTEFGGHPSLYLYNVAWQLLTIGVWSFPTEWIMVLPLTWTHRLQQEGKHACSKSWPLLPSHLFSCYANMPSTAHGIKETRTEWSQPTVVPKASLRYRDEYSYQSSRDERVNREQLKEIDSHSQHIDSEIDHTVTIVQPGVLELW